MSVQRAPAMVLLAIAVFAISTAAILVREADAAAVAVAMWRNLIGGVIMAPAAVVAIRRAGRELVELLAAQWPWLVVSGLFLGAHFGLWLGGLELTSVASSVTLVTMSPVFVALGTRFWLKESVSGRAWTGIVVAITGGLVLGLADVGDGSAGSNPLLGNAMSFAGAAAIAVYMLIGRRARSAGIPTSVYASTAYLVAAVALVPVAAITDVELVDFPATTWLIFAALVIGPQLLGHTLINAVLDRVRAATVSVATLAEPIGSAVLAWWLLEESPTWGFWVGAPIVIGGLVITVRASER